MNKFLVFIGILLFLAGLFELSQGKDDWWVRSLQGVGIAIAGIVFEKQKKAK